MIINLLWTWETLTEVKRFAYFIATVLFTAGSSNSYVYSVICVVEDAESVAAVPGSDIVVRSGISW